MAEYVSILRTFPLKPTFLGDPAT